MLLAAYEVSLASIFFFRRNENTAVPRQLYSLKLLAFHLSKVDRETPEVLRLAMFVAAIARISFFSTGTMLQRHDSSTGCKTIGVPPTKS